MKVGSKVLQGKPENDPKYVKEIASIVSGYNKLKIADEDKNIFRIMYLEYLRRGDTLTEAVEKTYMFFLPFCS